MGSFGGRDWKGEMLYLKYNLNDTHNISKRIKLEPENV